MSSTPHNTVNQDSALLDIAAELTHVAVLDHGSARRIAHPIASLPGLRLLIVSMKEGSVWTEHSTPGRITVQPLTGQVRFRWQDKEALLTPGHVIAFAPNVPHDVHADTDAAFLLTVARPALD